MNVALYVCSRCARAVPTTIDGQCHECRPPDVLLCTACVRSVISLWDGECSECAGPRANERVAHETVAEGVLSVRKGSDCPGCGGLAYMYASLYEDLEDGAIGCEACLAALPHRQSGSYGDPTPRDDWLVKRTCSDCGSGFERWSRTPYEADEEPLCDPCGRRQYSEHQALKADIKEEVRQEMPAVLRMFMRKR